MAKIRGTVLRWCFTSAPMSAQGYNLRQITSAQKITNCDLNCVENVIPATVRDTRYEGQPTVLFSVICAQVHV